MEIKIHYDKNGGAWGELIMPAPMLICGIFQETRFYGKIPKSVYEDFHREINELYTEYGGEG